MLLVFASEAKQYHCKLVVANEVKQPPTSRESDRDCHVAVAPRNDAGFLEYLFQAHVFPVGATLAVNDAVKPCNAVRG